MKIRIKMLLGHLLRCIVSRKGHVVSSYRKINKLRYLVRCMHICYRAITTFGLKDYSCGAALTCHTTSAPLGFCVLGLKLILLCFIAITFFFALAQYFYSSNNNNYFCKKIILKQKIIIEPHVII